MRLQGYHTNFVIKGFLHIWLMDYKLLTCISHSAFLYYVLWWRTSWILDITCQGSCKQYFRQDLCYVSLVISGEKSNIRRPTHTKR